MTRDEALQNFLNQCGLKNAKRVPLAADASARTYDRLFQNEKNFVLMNSPLSENPDKFVFFDEFLSNLGVRVPKILAKDMENGFILLEDFGDNTFTKLLADGYDEAELYELGVEALIQIQKNIKLPDDKIPAYTYEQMLGGVMLLPNWFGKYILPQPLDETAISEFRQIWEKLSQTLMQVPTSLNLLDYHVDNLMITPDHKCGLLDFQDARIGPATYDLMSLLEDERRDVPKAIRDSLIERYFKALPQFDTPFVRETLSVVAMQRHTRVIGLFIRLFMRDKKEKYLGFIPFIWSLCERHLDEPLFHDYRDWLNRYIPQEIRKKKLTTKDFS